MQRLHSAMPPLISEYDNMPSPAQSPPSPPTRTQKDTPGVVVFELKENSEEDKKIGVLCINVKKLIGLCKQHDEHLKKLEKEKTKLEADVSEMKTEITALKLEVAEMRKAIDGDDSEYEEMKDGQAQGTGLSEHVQILYDGFEGVKRDMKNLDRHLGKIEKSAWCSGEDGSGEYVPGHAVTDETKSKKRAIDLDDEVVEVTPRKLAKKNA